MDRTLQSTELDVLFLMRGVSRESVLGLLTDCPIRELGQGERLLDQGQANDTMYMVLQGSLGVYLEEVSGDPVAVIEAGQVVGEISVIDGSPATAHVVALQPCRLIAVDEETFWIMVEASHDFATNLLGLLARRMRANDFALADGLRRRRMLERDALFDALTGIYNRRWLDRRLPRLVRRHEFSKAPLTVMMLDVDHFKHFNDAHGHAAGDRVLAGVGQVLMDHLRPTDLSARYGGEEFTVILPDTDLAGGHVAAERVRQTVASRTFDDGQGGELPPVTVSIGLAQLDPGEDAQTLLGRADRALYGAKSGGRDRVES